MHKEYNKNVRISMNTLFPYFCQRHKKKNFVYILENHDDYNMAVEFC